MNAAFIAAAVAAGEAVEHGAKPGLPQLNPNDFAPQLIWLALTFALVYLVLSRIALPRVGEVLEERKSRIDRDIAEAERLKAETDKALADYEQALADARAKASGIAKDVREKLAADTEAKRADVEAKIAARLSAAEAQIASAKASALQSIEVVAVDVAGQIVKTLVGQDVSADDVKRALAAAPGE